MTPEQVREAQQLLDRKRSAADARRLLDLRSAQADATPLLNSVIDDLIVEIDIALAALGVTLS